MTLVLVPFLLVLFIVTFLVVRRRAMGRQTPSMRVLGPMVASPYLHRNRRHRGM